MGKEHFFEANIRWTGNLGEGTNNYQAYSRNHVISVDGKADITSSSVPVFRGDASLHTPEDLLVAALSSCHMLWFLHLCADAGVNVLEYSDKATGTMVVKKGGTGKFEEVTLHPIVVVAEPGMIEKANSLHKEANAKCFIANSCNFPIKHEPSCKAK